jgi:nitroreductase/NAD-dependent dihydropyrimidine dehydrogenase PreA subunit
MMALLTIDEQTCTQCGICTAICPRGIIHFREKSYPRQLPGSDESCARCGHCLAICPSGSLTHREIPLEQCPPIDNKLEVSFKQVSQLIKSRRSIRFYKDKEVLKEEIERIIDVARFSPTGHNAQEVQWLVVNDKDKLRELTAIGVDWFRSMAEGDAPWALEMQGVLKMQDMGFDIFLRNTPALVTAFAEKDNPIAATDCAIALSYFDLVATSAGLGCCWAGFFYISAGTFKPMIKAIGLPEGFIPYGALMVGYPKYRYQRMPARKAASIIYRP